MKAYHTIENFHFTGAYMIVTIDGQERRGVRIEDISKALTRATEQERNTFEISASGYGIHWPLIDEDIAVDGLLGIVHIRESKRKTA